VFGFPLACRDLILICRNSTVPYRLVQTRFYGDATRGKLLRFGLFGARYQELKWKYNNDKTNETGLPEGVRYGHGRSSCLNRFGRVRI